MDTIQRARQLIREHSEHIGCSTALSWARSEENTVRVEMDSSGDGYDGKIEMDGFDVHVSWRPDYDADTSWLGEFSEEWEEGAVKVRSPHRFSRARWFIPAIPVKEHFDGLHKLGLAKGVARELAEKYVRQEMEILLSEENRFFVCMVTAYKNGVELGSSSLGGCDLGTEYRQAIEWAETLPDQNGLLSEAVSMAKENLAKLCGSAA